MRIPKVFSQLYPIKCRYMVVYGGRRSAKSYSVSKLLVRRGLEHRRKIVVMRKFATTIRLSTWERVKRALEESIGLANCKLNKSDREITLPNGTQFMFIGADDPEKLKSMEGTTDLWLEEANEFEEVDFDTLDAGLSEVASWPCQIWFTFNPIPYILGAPHWLQTRFKLGKNRELSKVYVDGDVCVLRTWFRDNPFCPKEAVAVLERYRETNQQLWEMWGLGLFTYLEGVILTRWDVVTDIPGGADFLGDGLDFGFANDPAALVQVYGGKNYELWVRQLVYNTGLTNNSLSNEMLRLGVRKHTELIIADSAEPKSIQELCDLGWFVQPSEKGPDYKRAAALKLQDYTIHVTAESIDLQRELSTWTWDRDKKTQKFLPVPRDGDDHTIDALIGVATKRLFRGTLGRKQEAADQRRPVMAGMREARF